MDDPPLIGIAILVCLIVINGFFSMSEMAIVSARKNRLRAKAEQGKKAYRNALKAAENPSRFLSTIQIGITLIGTLAGAFGGATLAGPLAGVLSHSEFLAPYAQALAVGIVVLLITFCSIVLGELFPKQLALSNPEGIAAKVVPVLQFFSTLFKPIVLLLSWTTSILLKLFHVDAQADRTITEEEIHVALKEAERYGVVAKKERSMMEGVFYLGDRPVETFMTHRSELSILEIDAGEELVKKVILEDLTRSFFPIVDGGLDNVVGLVSSREVLVALLNGTYKNLKTLAKKPCFIPGTMTALKAFEAFKRSGSELLLIIDEYGGLEGALSIRNLVEEIIGEVFATKTNTEEVVEREDGSYLVGGLVNIDEFAEIFQVSDEIGGQREFHTLSGFIMETIGEIPRTGATFTWNHLHFEIVDMDGNRIDKVIVKPMDGTGTAVEVEEDN